MVPQPGIGGHATAAANDVMPRNILNSSSRSHKPRTSSPQPHFCHHGSRTQNLLHLPALRRRRRKLRPHQIRPQRCAHPASQPPQVTNLPRSLQYSSGTSPTPSPPRPSTPAPRPSRPSPATTPPSPPPRPSPHPPKPPSPSSRRRP